MYGIPLPCTGISTFQAYVVNFMNFVRWLYAIFCSLLTGQVKLLLLRAGTII